MLADIGLIALAIAHLADAHERCEIDGFDYARRRVRMVRLATAILEGAGREGLPSPSPGI